MADAKVGRVGPFELGPELARGSLFRAQLATDVRDGKIYVLKSVSVTPETFAVPEYIDSKEFKQHVAALTQLTVRRCASLVDILRTSRRVYFVYLFAAGGPLMSTTVGRQYISQEQPEGRLCEEEARFYFQQLIAALRDVHRQSNGTLYHGDLRMEDLLLDKPAPLSYVPVTSKTRELKPELRVNGIGMVVVRINSGVPNRTARGQHHMAAPELLQVQGPITPETFAAADVWSCGVALYAMLSGAFPFDDSNPNVLTAKICAGEFVFPKFFSPGVRGVRHLIANMLVCDPSKRFTYDRIVQHPWFDIKCDRRMFAHLIATPANALAASGSLGSPPTS